jgi:uncharacterized repeat protein (TIGR01451 family)
MGLISLWQAYRARRRRAKQEEQRRQRPWRNRTHLTIERLEDRVVPSVTSSQDPNTGALTLSYDGTNNDAITIQSLNTGSSNFQVNAGSGTTLNNTLGGSAAYTGVTSITVVGSTASTNSLTFDTNDQTNSVSGAISVSDIDNVLLTDSNTSPTGTLTAGSFSESGGTNATTTLDRPLITTGTFTADVPTVNLNADVSAATITGTATIVNVQSSAAQIQDGIDVAAASGATVNVAAGTYAGNLTVNKSLTLLGANAGINPNTGTRGAETIVEPGPTSSYDTSSVILVTANNVTIDGFTVQGSIANPPMGQSAGSTLASGTTVYAAAGISNSSNVNTGGSAPSTTNISGLTVQNNIVQDFTQVGVYGDTSDYTPSTGNTITDNFITDIPNNGLGGYYGEGVIIYDDFYAQITNNTITKVRTGIQTGNNAYSAGAYAPSISGNTVSAYVKGIYFNLQYDAATPFTISNNTITQADSTVSPTYNVGLLIQSIQGSVSSVIQGNNISGFLYGVEFAGNNTTSTVTLQGGTLSNNGYGVWDTNNDYYYPASYNTTAALSGVTITNSTNAGIWIDSTSPDSGGQYNTTNSTSLAIGGGTTVSGGPVGLLVAGPNSLITGNTLNDTTFTGQTGNYITLASGALFSQQIDATGVTFDGVTGATATLPENYAIEDKITHAVDDATLGFIRVKAANVFVTPNSFNSPDTTTPDIQRGINVASSGDTVNVAAGTYNNHLTINKSLTLDGAQQGVDAQTRSTANESIVDGGGYAPFYVTANNVTIDGFTIQGATNNGNAFPNLYGIELGQGTYGSSILDNIIQNNTAGIALENNSTTTPTVISGNLIQNNNQPGPATGAGIYSDEFVSGLASATGSLTNVQITNNTFSGNTGDSGIDFSFDPTYSASNITISSNEFTGNARAVFLYGVTNSSFTQNTITGSTGYGASFPTGDVRIYGGDSGLNIANNLFQGNSAVPDAIKINDGSLDNRGPSDPNSTITINDNSISGYNSGDGLDLVDGYSGTLDATYNWWGDATGPTSPNNPGGTGEPINDPNNQVNFSPYLTDGTNTATGRGFTPVANPSIGIAVVGTGNPGDTLVVNATGPDSGTYSLNGGTPVPFSNVTRFTFTDSGTNNTFTINNPSSGLFAPTDGIVYVGGGTGSLQIEGGQAVTETFDLLPDSSGHNGTIALVNGGTTANYTYSGLSPVLVNAGTPNAVIFNLPNDGQDHKSILEASTTAGFDDLRSQNNTFETTTFADPSTSLTVNVTQTSPVGESLTLAALDTTVTPANITYQGGPGDDFFNVEATPAGATTTFNTGTDSAGGPDTAFIGGNASTGPQKLDNIAGPVIITGQSGNTVLDVEDQASTTDNTYTITSSSVQRAGTGLVSYSNVQTINLFAGSGNDTVNTQSLASTTQNIDGGSFSTNPPGNTLDYNAQNASFTDNGSTITQAGAQPINYTNFQTINVSNSTGGITVDGTSAADTLVVNATNANSGTYQLNNGPVVSFSGISSFTFDGGGGADSFIVNNPTTGLFAPTGGISYIDTGSASLQDLGGTASSGTYTPNPSGNPQNAGTLTHTYNTTTQTITFTGLAPITDTVTEPTFTIDSTDAGGVIFYSNGGTSGTTQLNTVTDSAPGVETVNFGNKTSVQVNTDATSAGAPKTVDEQFSTAATGLTNVTFADNGGGGSAYNVLATPAAVSTIITGSSGGNDSVSIADNQNKLDQILGPVTFNGSGSGNSLFVTDTGSTTGYTYSINSTTINRTGGAVTPGTITYTGLQTVQLSGGSGGNTIDQTGAASGTNYTINAGSGNDNITVSGTGSAAGLTVNGQGGADTLTVDFSNGNPSPAGGIFYHAGGTAGDALNLINVNASTVTNTFLPDSSGTPHLGTINADGSVVHYDGVTPVSITGTMANLVINLPQGDGDNQARLQASGTAGVSEIVSGNSTFETTQFSNPSTSLTVNTGNDGETVTFAHMDPAYNPTNGTTITGGTGADTLNVDFSSGVNVIPTGGITFNGGSDNGDAIAFTAGYTATNVTDNYTDAHSGSINVDGNLVTYSGLSQSRGIFDQLAASTRTFNFASTTSNNITLGDDPKANNGISRISSTASNPTTDFANPATGLTVNLGNAGDTITAGPLDATSPPATIDLNGGTGSDTFDVTPSTGSTFNIDGNLPDPPASPGDTLNATIPAGSNPILTSTATPTGYTGNYTFLSGGYQPVNFTRIETLTPSSVDLSISKDDGGDTEGEIPGTPITYTIVATNNSTLGVSGVTISDMFPAAEFSSDSWTASETGGASGFSATGSGNINDTAVTMPGGSTITYTVTALINPSALGTLSNTAIITPPSGVTDSNPANNSSTDSDTLTAQADLAVTKSATSSTVTAGTNLTYTLTVANNGPSTAQGVQLTDATPADTTFVSFVQDSGPTFTITQEPSAGGTGFVTATDASLLPTGFNSTTPAVFTFVVHVNSSTPSTATIDNTAIVQSNTTIDPVPGNNQSSTSTSVATSADLSVTKTGPASPVTAGNNLTYTITVTNSGPSDAQSVSLTDAVPTGTTFVSESQTGGPGFTFTNPSPGGTGTVSGSIASFASGASASFTLVVHALSSDTDGSTIDNTAQVSSLTPDPTSTDNTSTASDTVVTSADLVVSKTGPTTITAGTDATYTITLTNAGPSDAQNVSLTDAVPSGTTFVSESQTGGPGFLFSNPSPGGTGTVSGSIASFASGASATFTLVVHALSSDANNSTISNSVTALSSTADPTTSDNTSSVNSTVATSADLTISKSGPTTITAGTDATYTITLTNAGPSDAQNVSLTDAVPSGTTFVSESQTSGPGFTFSNPSAGGTGTVSGSIASFATGASATFTLVVHALSSDANNSTISNTANVSSSTSDPTSADNTSTVNSTVATSADLSISKSGPANVTAGSNITYTITLTNTGPSVAQSVSLTDAVPSGTTFVSESQTGGPTFTFSNPSPGGTGTVSGSIASFTAGSSASFTLVVHALSSDSNGSTISNTANVSSSTSDPTSADNTSTVNSTLGTSAGLSVAASGPSSANEGDVLTYTLSLSNNGPSNALNVVLTDVVPAGMTVLSITPNAGNLDSFTQSISGNIITETAQGPIPTGHTDVFTLTVQPVEDGSLTNSFSVSSSTAGSSTNPATVTTNVAEPGIALTGGITLSTSEFSSLSNVTLATFTHANGVEPASAFTATVNWGDGTSSQATVIQSGTTYSVVGSHTYNHEGNYTITVSVSEDGVSTSANSTASIGEAGLPSGVASNSLSNYINESLDDVFKQQPTAQQIKNLELGLLLLDFEIAATLLNQGYMPLESIVDAYWLTATDYNLSLGYLSGAGFDLNTTVNDMVASFVLESVILAANNNASS